MYLSKIRKIVKNKLIKLMQMFILIEAMFFCFPVNSVASSSIPLPTISTSVVHPLLVRTFSMVTSFESYSPDTSIERTYSFGSTIDFTGTTIKKGDLYFGFISPNNNEIFSWVSNGSETSIKKGLLPIVKGVEENENSTFSLTRALGEEIKYVVTGQEPTGMYLIFSLLVSPDADPSQIRKWIAIDMRPLFVDK
jgi:hypothetical protein